MFKLLVLLINCFFAKEAETTSEKCNEMFDPHSANIVDCCDAPQLLIDVQCLLECTVPSDDKCSCPNCLKKKNLVAREKDQFLKMFNQTLEIEFKAEEKKNWLLVISKSFEHCKPLIDIVNETDECQFPKYHQPMITCVRQQNFLNCPQSSFASTEKCEATRKFIKEQETCGTKYEDIFVIDDSIFDQNWDRNYECKKTFEGANLNSRKCVAFPDISPPRDVYQGCAKPCQLNGCCVAPCLLNATSSDDFGREVVKDKLIEFYKSYCKNSGIDFGIWKPVIESSLGICYPLISNVTTFKKCNIKLKFDSLLLCMRQELFLNAPSSLINDADQFEKIKTFISSETKCGHKFEEKFIIDVSFWFY